jgi:8-amino-7-oxononanoate synthase
LRVHNRLSKFLAKREDQQSLRELKVSEATIDFSSNDYLGFAKDPIEVKALPGSTGSRLISGQFEELHNLEHQLASDLKSEASLIYSSGYAANVGLISAVAQRGDVILYDALCHASIRDALKLTDAKSVKFTHNDLQDLESKLKLQTENTEVFVIIESIYSMDGDGPDFDALLELTEKYSFNLIIDEAHSIGICGENGVGLITDTKLQDKVFARVITFGKALGAEGAAIIGSEVLKQYLVNTSRSFIYSTGISPIKTQVISLQWQKLKGIDKAQQTCEALKSQLIEGLKDDFNLTYGRNGNIVGIIIEGNNSVRSASKELHKAGIAAKPILSPTVVHGKERIRICIHAFNTPQEITLLTNTLIEWKKKDIL